MNETTTKMVNLYYTASDIKELLDISRSKAYDIVRTLNGAAYLFEKSDKDADEKHRRYIEELKAAIEKTDEAKADL